MENRDNTNAEGNNNAEDADLSPPQKKTPTGPFEVENLELERRRRIQSVRISDLRSDRSVVGWILNGSVDGPG